MGRKQIAHELIILSIALSNRMNKVKDKLKFRDLRKLAEKELKSINSENKYHKYRLNSRN